MQEDPKDAYFAKTILQTYFKPTQTAPYTDSYSFSHYSYFNNGKFVLLRMQ